MFRRRPGTSSMLRSLETTGGQDTVTAFLTRVGLVLFGLLIQGLLAYMLLPEGRGSYAVCLAFGTSLGLLFTPGAQQGTQYFVMTRRTNVSQAVSCALTICLAGGGVAVALSVPMIGCAIAFFDKAEPRSFYLGLGLIPLTAFSVAIEHQLAAFRRFRRLAIYSLFRSAANVLAILLLVWVWELGVDGAIASFAAGHLVMITACLEDLRRHCGLIREMPTHSSLMLILSYGLKGLIARAVDGLGLPGILALGLIASPSDIGLFAAAGGLMLGLALISNSVGNALLPRIAGSEPSTRDSQTLLRQREGAMPCRNGRPELVTFSLRLVYGATAIALLPVLAISTPLVRLLLSHDFLPVVSLLWIMAPGILAYASAGILMTYFKGINRPEICSWAVCFGSCADLGILFLLYPIFGVQAAGWAMTIGMTCRCLLLAVVFGRTTGMTWRPIWLPRYSDMRYCWSTGQSIFDSRPKKGSPTNVYESSVSDQ